MLHLQSSRVKKLSSHAGCRNTSISMFTPNSDWVYIKGGRIHFVSKKPSPFIPRQQRGKAFCAAAPFHCLFSVQRVHSHFSNGLELMLACLLNFSRPLVDRQIRSSTCAHERYLCMYCIKVQH